VRTTPPKFDWAAAAFLTLVVICLHVMAATSGGGLWRDEANTVGIATLPHLADVWKNLSNDSFPILWLLIVRAVSAVFGLMNDTAFRTLGFVIGAGVVGVLWLNARSFGHRLPLISLVLLGMSPSMIRWGDTMRAYGFGILLSLLTCALLWRFLQRPGVARFVAAALAAIASVHALYYNAVLLLSFCAGGVAVCLYRRSWKQGFAVLMVGVLAAVSLLPYVPVVRQAGSWSAIVRMPNYDVAWFWMKLNEALVPGGRWIIVVWLVLLAAAVIGGLLAIINRDRFRLSELQHQVVIFSLVSLLVGVAGNYLFLKILSYYTSPWYYLPMLALAAVCIDAILGTVVRTPRARVATIVAVLLVTVATLVPTRRAVRTRLTDVDIVASHVGQEAERGDLVVVSRWQYGVTFDRYYRGAANWITIPPVESHRFVRYDKLVNQMKMPDQTAPVVPVQVQVARALSDGHRVYVVGQLLIPPTGQQPTVLPAVNSGEKSLPEGAYMNQWSAMVGYFMQRHAIKVESLPIEANRVVSRYENLSVLVVSGWRP
jgi:hypothetical protein